MRSNRLVKIYEIIKEFPITTQEELQRELKKHGFDVTQATVSRDMKELRLSKTLDANGVNRYTAPSEGMTDELYNKFSTIFRESVLSCASCGNLVIIKCYTGMGNAACAALDSMEIEGIVGTIAGDDTIFAAVDTEQRAKEVVKTLGDISAAQGKK